MDEKQSFYIGVKGIIRSSAGEIMILKDNSKGKWELPGGRIDRNQSIEQALTREIGEEIIGATMAKQGGLVDLALGEFEVKDNHRLLLLFYSIEVSLPESIELSHEHSELAWVNKRSISGYEFYATDKAAIQKAFNDTTT